MENFFALNECRFSDSKVIDLLLVLIIYVDIRVNRLVIVGFWF